MKTLFSIYVIALMQLTSSCKRSEPTIYLIPEGYTGRVVVVFNQTGKPIKYKDNYNHDAIYVSKVGTPVKYENGHRVYEIPSNGILLTQFESTYGWDFNMD